MYKKLENLMLNIMFLNLQMGEAKVWTCKKNACYL